MRQIHVGRPENQRRDLIIAAVLVILSWSMTGLDSSQTLGLTRLVRTSVLSPFLAADVAFERRSDLAERAARLEAERDRLYQQSQGAADLERENRELRELLQIPDRRPGTFVIGELVPGRPTVGDSHAFLLRSAGIRDVGIPTGVSVPAGLVGVLRSVSGDVGLGEFWTHPDFRVSVRSTTGGATGIIRSTVDEAGETLMLVEGVPYQARMAEGSLLETAGLGGVFPAGIPVGTVITEAASRSGWSHSYLVEPAVRPGAVSAATAWRRPAEGALGWGEDSPPTPEPALPDSEVVGPREETP